MYLYIHVQHQEGMRMASCIILEVGVVPTLPGDAMLKLQ